MADHPLKPAMDRRLGRPLPHQLPNPTRANPLPINLSPPIKCHLAVDESFNSSIKWNLIEGAYPVLLPVSRGYSEERGMFPRVTHPSATNPERSVRLACVRPAASVHSEPGSNSQVEMGFPISLTSNLRTSALSHKNKVFPFHVLKLPK